MDLKYNYVIHVTFFIAYYESMDLRLDCYFLSYLATYIFLLLDTFFPFFPSFHSLVKVI